MIVFSPDDQARARVLAGVTRSGALRVLVTGGRRYDDPQQLGACLGGIATQQGIKVLIEGGASGADALTKAFGMWAGVPVESHPADWACHGRAAGPIRNARMLREGRPDLVVAFPGERGTADMIAKAHVAGVTVLEVVS